MDEEQGGSQKLFRRAALKSQRRAALGSIHINIPSAFWAESLLVTAFVVATFVEVIAQILSSKPSDRRMPCNSIGNTPIRSLRIPDLAKNQEVGCPMESRSSSRPRFAVQLVVAAIICFASALGAGQKAVVANKGQPPSASVTLQTVLVTACGQCADPIDFTPFTILGIHVTAIGQAELAEEVATAVAKLKAQMLENSSTCMAVGNAQSPQYYQQLGKNASNLPSPINLVDETIILTQFYHGGPFDAQASGSSPAYANYVYGVYMAAIGASLQFSLEGANTYASEFATYNWSLVGPASTAYPSIPEVNVENITLGFDGEQKGTLCTVTSSSSSSN